MLRRFGELPGKNEEAAQIGPQFDIVRLFLQQSLEFLYCRIPVPVDHMHFPQIHGGVPVIGIDGEGLPEVLLRFLESFLVRIEHTEIIACLEMLRLYLEYIEEGPLGFLVSAGILKGDPEVVEALDPAWLALQGPPVLLYRLFRLSRGFQRDS